MYNIEEIDNKLHELKDLKTELIKEILNFYDFSECESLCINYNLSMNCVIRWLDKDGHIRTSGYHKFFHLNEMPFELLLNYLRELISQQN